MPFGESENSFLGNGVFVADSMLVVYRKTLVETRCQMWDASASRSVVISVASCETSKMEFQGIPTTGRYHPPQIGREGCCEVRGRDRTSRGPNMCLTA